MVKQILRVGQKVVNVTNVSHSSLIHRTRPLTLGDKTNFLSVAELDNTDSKVEVKVSQYRDSKCDLSHNDTVSGISDLRKRISGFSPARATSWYIILGRTEFLRLTAAFAKSLSEDHCRLHNRYCLTVQPALWLLQQTNIAATLSRLQRSDVRRDNRGPCLRFTDPRPLFALHVLDRVSGTDQVRDFIQASWQTVGHISISRYDGITYIRHCFGKHNQMDSTPYPVDGDSWFLRNARPYPAIYIVLPPI
jgi:hypothetical protein